MSASAPAHASAVSRPGLDERLGRELVRLREAQLYRVRRIIDGAHGVDIEVDGQRCLNFCSNDYLGLAADPRVAEAARRTLSASGTGSGASALVSGYNAEHARLEEELAEFVKRPRVLLFSSGWAANLGVLRAVLTRDDRLIADELNHASLIDGGRLSGARYVRVAHCDLSAYQQALCAVQAADDRRQETLVVTDSVFSMDGDVAPLPELSRLCTEHGAALMVDDAHGFCVSPSPVPRIPSPEIYVATLGKALGASGAFVAGSENLIEYLIQRARSWIFSTAPPPAIAAAARAALRIVQAEPQRRAALFANVRQFRAGAAQLGIPLGASASPIQPLVIGDETRALGLSKFLRERGCWVAAIRPPTVPRGTSRLRITLSASHAPAQIERLLQALADGLRQLPGPAP
ncbi:MAG TPA: 8-amino-7-oxononanoate synthase [Stenotrophobium sp.]|nr:8-amino-7-oxononanoate synthase [Stenotrophobium sp.]